MGIFISLILINIGAVLFKEKNRTDSALSYFTVMCMGIMLLYVGGIVNLLMPAAILFFASIVVLAVAYVVKKGLSGTAKAVKDYLDFPIIINNFFSACMIVMYAVQKPYFYYWDEYSFWGPSAKFVKYFHTLYSIKPYTVNGMGALPCGNSLLNYLITFFTQDFQDWHLLAAYAVFYIAVFAVVASLVKKKTGNFPLTVITFLMMFLSPFMSTFHEASVRYDSLLYGYGTSMVDFNIAVAFLGAVAVYLAVPDKKWYIFPLMFLTTVKNTSIFFAFLAVAVICCFVIFDRIKEDFNFMKVAKTVLLTAAVPVVIYLSWNIHLSQYSMPGVKGEFMLKDPNPPVIEQTKTEDVERADNSGATVLSIVVPSLRTERYNQVLGQMREMFLSEDITLFGKDKFMVIGLILIGIIATISADKKSRIAVGLVNLGLAAGCYVYATAISYFMTFFGDGMVEYPRYMTSYYFSWMFIAVVLLAINCRKEWFTQILFTVVTVVTVAFLGFTGLSYTVFAAPDNAYSQHIQIEKDMKGIKDIVSKGDTVYLVLPDQDTIGYFYYSHHLIPALYVDTKNTGIDFSISFREKIDWSSDRTYYNVASPETFAKVMQSYFDYVYVISPDVEVYESYGHLFSDGMTTGTFYRVTENDIPMQEVIFDE